MMKIIPKICIHFKSLNYYQALQYFQIKENKIYRRYIKGLIIIFPTCLRRSWRLLWNWTWRIPWLRITAQLWLCRGSAAHQCGEDVWE
jgi:hypothetical protein